jgi:hypothetical protein
MKIRPVGAELFHADVGTDRRIDMTKPIVAFRSFANAPKNVERTPNLSCTKFWKSMLTGEVVFVCTAPQEVPNGFRSYVFLGAVSSISWGLHTSISWGLHTSISWGLCTSISWGLCLAYLGGCVLAYLGNFISLFHIGKVVYEEPG